MARYVQKVSDFQCPHCQAPIDAKPNTVVWCKQCRTAVDVPGAYERFHIRAVLNEDNGGGHYCAYDPLLARTVSLQVFSRPNREVREAIIRQSSILAKINHPNVGRVHRTGEHTGTIFIESEYLAEDSLQERMNQKRLSEAEVVAIVQAIAQGLEVAHENGMLHLDIHPKHVRYDPAGTLKVTEFASYRSALRSKAILATPLYVAPELIQLARGETIEIDERADIYSLGAVLYHLLAGRPPFQSDSVKKTIDARLTEEPLVIDSLNEYISPLMGNLVESMLRRNADERPRDMGEILARLEGIGDQPTPKRVRPRGLQIPTTNLPVASVTSRCIDVGAASADTSAFLSMTRWLKNTCVSASRRKRDSGIRQLVAASLLIAIAMSIGVGRLWQSAGVGSSVPAQVVRTQSFARQQVMALLAEVRSDVSNTAISLSGAQVMHEPAAYWSTLMADVLPNVHVKVTGATSNEGCDAIMSGAADLALMTRALKRVEREAILAKYGSSPVQVPVASEVIAVIVHPSNLIAKRGLDIAELDAIFSRARRKGYSERIADWKQLGGDGGIRILVHREEVVAELFKWFVMKGGAFQKEALFRPSSAHVLEVVAKRPDAIGFIRLCDVTPEVSVVPIGIRGGTPVIPTVEAKIAETYTLGRVHYLTFIESGFSPQLRDLIEISLSQSGQAFARQKNFDALPHAVLKSVRERLSVISSDH